MHEFHFSNTVPILNKTFVYTPQIDFVFYLESAI